MKKLFQIVMLTIFLVDMSYAQSNKVLFVMSEADTLLLNKGEKKRQTGVFLNEFYQAYKAIIDNGYKVDFSTPTGKKPTIDQESLNDTYWKHNPELKQEAVDFWENSTAFSKPLILREINQKLDEYIGLVVPGGQGLMMDLIYDKNIPLLLHHFAKEQKAIGLICHAPVLITTIPKSENPFMGYNVNSVTPFEEFYIETFIMKGKPKNRKIARQLKEKGLKYMKKGAGKSYALRDRNLVTSQNPYSGNMFNELFLNLLGEVKK